MPTSRAIVRSPSPPSHSAKIASSRSLTDINSPGIALPPLLEIVVRSLHTREHRRFLLCNLLAKRTSFQAPWSRANQLAQQPRTSSDCRTISLSVTASVRDVQTIFPATAPLAVDPVQRVPAFPAPPAHETRPDSALASAHRRHGPLPQLDLDLDPAGHRDHKAAGGSSRERGAGPAGHRDHKAAGGSSRERG